MSTCVEDRLLSVLQARPDLIKGLRLKWTPYIPHDPTPKQHAFLMLPHREAFYGGAAGGGKSDALLMGALQYVDNPHYSAIIFRRTLTDLKLRGALIERSMEWLSGTDAKYSPGTHTWTFPSGATIAFGYMTDAKSKYRYQSAHFHYVAFDETSQFYQEDYLYMFSRCRRNACQLHLKPSRHNNWNPPGFNPRCKTCKEYRESANIPLRVRAASNPGGMGHTWLKKRFGIKRFELGPDAEGKQRYTFRGTHPRRPFISANLTDNPFLDESEYIEALSELDPVTREQLLAGDWEAAHSGRFKKEWIDPPGKKSRRFTVRPGYYIMGTDGNGEAIPTSACRLFAILDPAASAREGPADELLWENRDPSWTVLGIFALTPSWDLLWVDNLRFQKEIPDGIEAIKQAYRQWCPDFIGVEANGLGIGVFQMLSAAGLPVEPLRAGSADKLVRATPATVRMKNGKIWLPQTAPWLEDLEDELFHWTGHPNQQDDQIDVLAYAAKHVNSLAGDDEQEFPRPNHHAEGYNAPRIVPVHQSLHSGYSL